MRLLKSFSSLFLVLLLWLPTNSFAQNGSYTVYGLGALSCADIIKKDGYKEDLFGEWADKSWVMGFVTALNLEYGRSTDINQDFSGVLLQLQKTCKDEPMSDVMDNLMEIYHRKFK